MKIIKFVPRGGRSLPCPTATHRTSSNTDLVARLANHLEVQLQIVAGNQLVLHLGDGTERTNSAALRTWVSHQILEAKGLTPQQMYDELAAQLEKDLTKSLCPPD